MVGIIGLQWLTVTLAMVGKLAITASYGAVYIFSTEQFPTVVRNAGLGAGSTCARVGSITAPYVNIAVSTFLLSSYIYTLIIIYRAIYGNHCLYSYSEFCL